MVEQAVQTVPLAGAAQKRGKTPTQLQGKQPARPTQRSGRAGSLVQKENVPASKLTVAPKEEKSHIFLFLQHFYFLQLTLIMKIINQFMFQAGHHLSRVQPRFKAKALRTRNKGKNKVSQKHTESHLLTA